MSKAKKTEKFRRFENKQDAIDNIWEGFLGWDVYEILELMTEQISSIADVTDIPYKDEIISRSDELLKQVQEGKKNRIKIVNEMRTLWKTGEYEQSDLAILFDLSEDSICSMVTNKTLYDEEYQKWIDKQEIDNISFVDKDGHWKMKNEIDSTRAGHGCN